METHSQPEKVSRGFFSERFVRFFRGMFRPVSRGLHAIGVTPNVVTFASFILAIATGVLFGMNMIYIALVVGITMSLLDIVDGQMAKEFGGASKFGGVLDSTIDRYNEFCVFAGFGYRYFVLGRPGWILFCALAFLGSVMISYVKSRAEAAGFECKVGLLQRPERLAFIGVCVVFGSVGIDVAVVTLALATQVTVLTRLVHVWRQSR
jgi:CDP-diacylglycerol---glycerol-3-phosphate 3-phosphatidyltransferase